MAVAALTAVSNWDVIGRTIGPECSLGFTAADATVTVQGWSSRATCDALVKSLPLAAGRQGRGPGTVLCTYQIDGARYEVNDRGVVQIVGAGLCEMLRERLAAAQGASR